MLVLRDMVNGSEQILTVDERGASVIRLQQPKEDLSEDEQVERWRSSEQELLRVVSETGVLGLRTADQS